MLVGVLGARLEALLLGVHWIVPRVEAHDHGTVRPQPMHTDILHKGEVLAIAVHAGGLPMGTLLDPLADVFTPTRACASAAVSSAFAYDSGALHGAPGRTNVEGPYPAFDVSRAFFMIASLGLPSATVAAHQSSNRLCLPPVRMALT